jgi:N6-adenosine-specific RNA methylase IME4
MAYSCIIADSPWQYDDKMAAMKRTGLGASSQYHTMAFAKICTFLRDTPASRIVQQGPDPWDFCELPLSEVIAENAHLWLWITNPFLVHGYGQWLCDQWGFQPKTLITWVKGRLVVRASAGADTRRERRVYTELHHDPDDGELMVDPELVQHFAQGHYTRGTTEHVMFAVRGQCPALVHDLPSAFIYPGRWLGRLHSEKPPIIHEWAERMSPGPRLELFSRRTRAGWDAIGDELA